MDGGRGEGGEETVGDEEIVDTPPDVLLSCLEAVGPPRERLFFGMQVTERVGKTILEQLAELLSFFIGEARIALVGLGVLQVDLFMCHVHVSTYNHRFLGVELTEIAAEVLLPYQIGRAHV